MKKFRLLMTAFALFLVGSYAFAQTTIKVTGVVTEASTSFEAPGVAIVEKGNESNRTITDDFGNYSITVPANAVLVFTGTGYQSVEVSVDGKSTVNVSLEDDAIMLESAISVGYGSAKKVGNIVGNVTTVKADAVKNAPTASALDYLQGQVAGMQVLTTGGVAGDNNISMKIHGVGSLSSSSEPLFIVDGTQSSSSAVMAMSPNDILNITVLSDASATSIYGSQGANGVVVVTTKSGSYNSDATVTVTSLYGISTLANEQFYKNMMSGPELKNFWMRSGLMTADAIKKTYTDNGFDANTQWYKYFQRLNNPQYQNDVTIEGGSDKTAYLIAASQFHQDGNTIGNFYDRYTFRTNLQARPKDWLKVGVNVNASLSQDMANENWGNSSESGPYKSGGMSYVLNPLIPAVVENGKYPNGLYDQYFYTENYVNKYTTYRAIASAFAEIEPVKNLVYTARVGTDAYVKFMDRYLKPSSQISSTGMVQKSAYYGAKTTVNNTLEYKMFFNDNKDDLSILLGHEFLDYGHKNQIAFGTGLTDDRYLTLDNTLASSRDVSQSKTQYRFLSFFAHADYSHADKYFLDFTIRNDASSRFGKNKRNGTFWAAGFMWKAYNEDFIKDNASYVNKLNFKASYGTQGNANVGNYTHLGTISKISTAYNGGYGIVLSSPSNEDITWENQSLLTIGVDTRLFNAVDVSLSYYDRRTNDMLMSVPQPYTTGFTLVRANVGAMQNNGIDLSVNVDIINTRDVSLSARATFAYNHEKVTKLFNGLNRWEIANTFTAYLVGSPVYFYGPIYAGVDPEDGAPMWYLPAEKTETVIDPVTGLETTQTTILKDITTKDPSRVTKTYNEEKLTQNTGIRRHEPINGGFGISGRYKNLSLRADFAYILGKHLYNNDAYFYANPNLELGSNQSKDVSDFWTPYNTNAKYPDWSKGYQMQLDTHMLEDASFLRLKSLVVGYSLPQSWLRNQGVFKSAMITFTGRNLLTFTKYSGMDPEVDSNLTAGIPGNTLQVLGGIELKF